ncbi:MAG: helix-turn-helix domain-containing protein [Alphaproteobacteria bacterium]|nr:helix-turn-helix domain-containing protein [Alphaproteobacteria bacterium]
MGIFFDQEWFDDRLKASGLTRAALAHAAGMSVDEVDMVFRDQRELEQIEVRAFARVLSVDPVEIASRSGAADPSEAAGTISLGEQMRGGAVAPRPDFVVTREVIAGIHERMDRLERLLEVVIAKVDKLQR